METPKLARLLSPLFAAAILLAAFLIVFQSGCAKKKSGSTSGGGSAYTSYTGAWLLHSNNTSATGSCPTGAMPDVSLTVASGGTWTFTMQGGGTAAGTIASFTGVVSGTLSEPSGCGTGTIVGSCSSYTACSGTHATTAGASGSVGGGWTLSRP